MTPEHSFPSGVSIEERQITDAELDGWLAGLMKLADHPNGVELIKSYTAFYNLVQAGKRPIVQLIKGRAGSRQVLIDSLSQAQKFVIITSPWLSKRSIDDEILSRMTALLERGCRVYIGWGYSYDIKGITTYSGNAIIEIYPSGECSVNATADQSGQYNAFRDLQMLRSRYREQMELKLLGTHEKYIVCDRQFTLIGSHNTLSSKDNRDLLYAPREMGLKTTDQGTIDGVVEDYFNAPDLRYSLRTPSKIRVS